MKKLALAIAALAIAAVPFTSFAHGDEADLSAASYYVDVETSGVYEETNGDAGLQTAAQDHDADGTFETPADTKLN